jgi:hypothetical protein
MGEPEPGLKLATKAKELRPNLKVLYTSGQAVTDGMMALFVENAAFLPKPYTIDQLATTILAKFGLGPHHSPSANVADGGSDSTGRQPAA